MCRQLDVMNRLNHLFKKMAKMQSPRVQCCMCAVSVMSALFGMFMLSAGVCLVLNYNFLEVDTSGLPPNLHNEEGKKVVGIILICVGIAALGVSGLVSIIFYTACSRSSTSSSSSSSKKGEEGEGRPSSQESQARHGHYNSNGITPARPPSSNGVSGGRRSGGAAAPLPNGRRGNGSREGAAAGGAAAYGRAGSSSGSVAGRNGTPPSASRPYRPGKKSRHHGAGRFRNSLPSHPEEAGGEGQNVGESRHSAPPSSSSRRLTFPDRSGHVNQGAQLDDDVVVASGSTSESSVTPPVVITVDSSYLNEKAPSSQSPSSYQLGQSDSELTKHSSGAGASSEVPSVSSSGPVEMRHKNSARNNFKEEEEEEEESGRMSRSTVTSSEATEGVEESAEDASKRLDAEMSTLLS